MGCKRERERERGRKKYNKLVYTCIYTEGWGFSRYMLFYKNSMTAFTPGFPPLASHTSKRNAEHCVVKEEIPVDTTTAHRLFFLDNVVKFSCASP